MFFPCLGFAAQASIEYGRGVALEFPARNGMGGVHSMGTESTDLVIILSSDWVGSTATRAQLGEEPADALQEVHDTLLRRVIAAAGGTVVKHYGDGVLATFNSATAALGAAVKIQQDFAATRASPDALARMDLRGGFEFEDAGRMEPKRRPAPVHPLKVRRSEHGVAAATTAPKPPPPLPSAGPHSPAVRGSRRLPIYSLAPLLTLAL